MVQSARVQEIVKGDDVVLKHQIMKDVAFNAEQSRAPVPLMDGDSVLFFYPQAVGEDLVGFAGNPITALPCDTFNVPVAGVIPAVGTTPQRGTSMFQAGLSRTVRALVTRSSGAKETYFLISEVDIFERGFPNSLTDTSGGVNPSNPVLNLP